MYSLLKLPPNRFQKSLPNGKVLHGLTHSAEFRGAGWKTLLITGSYRSYASWLAVAVRAAALLPFQGCYQHWQVPSVFRHWKSIKDTDLLATSVIAFLIFSFSVSKVVRMGVRPSSVSSKLAKSRLTCPRRLA